MTDPGGGQHGWGERGPQPGPPPTVPYVPPPGPYPAPPAGYPPPPGYGYQPAPMPPGGYQPGVILEAPKSKIVAGLLALFVGTLGIHNFYLGRNALGLTQLLLATVGGILTCGIATVAVAVWAFVECVVIFCGGINDRHGRPLV